MLKSRLLGSVICVYLALSTSASPSRAAGCEDTIARHMVGEAMLAAQFVAAAQKNGMTPDAINTTSPTSPRSKSSDSPIRPVMPI